MGIVSKLSETVEKKLKGSQRIINLKLPSYENDCSLQLFLNKYNVYYYDEKTGKIRCQKPLSKTIIDVFLWLLKCIMFAIECCLPIFAVSPSTLISLFNDLGNISFSLVEKASRKSITFLKNLSSHVRIRKNPSKKAKKIKKVICVPITENTSNDIRVSVELIADLIKSNRINNCGLVILSKITLQSPAQEILDLYDDEEKNLFVSYFKVQFLNEILNENYVEASKIIQEVIEADSLRVSEFEFIMQCLAFCYKNMNESEFIDIFSQSGLKINDDLHIGKQHHFIENTGHNKTFLHFCYLLLERYYRRHPRINRDELETTFKNIIDKIKSALIAKDEYFSAVKLLSLYTTSEEAVDNFIIASIHMEYVKNCINDECIMLIEEYKDCSERAKLFLQLLDLTRSETPDVEIINSISSYVKKLENADPVLRLCFMYYLVNPVYKCNAADATFMDTYKKLLMNATAEQQNNKTLLCLFAIQYLLLYSTIEDVKVHQRNARFAHFTSNFVKDNSAFIKDKKIYFKFVRSSNGIFVDDYSENLVQMELIKNDVAEYITESILFGINFGALYAYNDKIKNALVVYHDIKKDILKEMPLSVRGAYFNNLTVFRYLNTPTDKIAQSAIKSINGFLINNYEKGMITEEYIHLNLNLLVFQIIAGEQAKLTETFCYVQNLVANDKYYSFYFAQAQWLFCALNGKVIDDKPLPESVFFCNKISFFEQKKRILNEFADSEKPLGVSEINELLKSHLNNFENYEYFKRVETFSLIERWYE